MFHTFRNMLHLHGEKIKLLLLVLLPAPFFSQGQSKPHTVPDTSQNFGIHFFLENGKGKTINIATQKGKVIFLNFWALSCIPCKAEMPSINQLSKHFKNDTNVLVLPIDLDQDKFNSPKYMIEKEFGLTVYYAASQVPEALFHGEIPTTVVIDKDGRIIFFHEGQDDYSTDKFIGYIEELSKKIHYAPNCLK